MLHLLRDQFKDTSLKIEEKKTRTQQESNPKPPCYEVCSQPLCNNRSPGPPPTYLIFCKNFKSKILSISNLIWVEQTWNLEWLKFHTNLILIQLWWFVCPRRLKGLESKWEMWEISTHISTMTCLISVIIFCCSGRFYKKLFEWGDQDVGFPPQK